MKKLVVAAAFSALAVGGALHHSVTGAIGSASIAAIDAVLGLVVGDAIACPGNGNGGGKGNGRGNRR